MTPEEIAALKADRNAGREIALRCWVMSDLCRPKASLEEVRARTDVLVPFLLSISSDNRDRVLNFLRRVRNPGKMPAPALVQVMSDLARIAGIPLGAGNLLNDATENQPEPMSDRGMVAYRSLEAKGESSRSLDASGLDLGLEAVEGGHGTDSAAGVNDGSVGAPGEPVMGSPEWFAQRDTYSSAWPARPLGMKL